MALELAASSGPATAVVVSEYSHVEVPSPPVPAPEPEVSAPVLYTNDTVDYSGDPNDSGAPAALDSALAGSFFLRDSNDRLYQKLESGVWREVGSDTTTEALTLRVESSGVDATADGSVAHPFLTIQAALDFAPKKLAHPVTIQVGAGTFAGAYVNGFTLAKPADPAVGASLQIIGTYAAATATTGSSSGTATSGTAGSGSTHGTLTQTGAGWTVDQFAGKLLHTISGTGSGQYFPIVTNSATVLTIAGTWTAPASGTTFEVLDWATVISPAISRPASPLGAALATNQAFLQAGNVGDYGVSAAISFHIVYEALKIAPVAGSGLLIFGGPRTCVRRCWLRTTSTANALLTNGGVAGLLVAANVLENVSTASVASFSNIGFVQLSNNWIKGGSFGFSTAGGVAAANLVANYFSGQGSVSVLLSGVLNNSQFNNNKLVGGGVAGRGIDCIIGVTNTAASGMSVQSCDISGYTTAAIRLSGRHTFILSSVTGSSNTVGLELNRGSLVNINSATTLTGTTEISMDSATSTLATMRAASPKLITNTYGTIFYE